MRTALSILIVFLSVPAFAQLTSAACPASSRPEWGSASAREKAAMLHGCGEGVTELRATHTEKVFNRPLAIGGAVILGVSYSLIAFPLAIFDGAFHFGPEVRGAYVPVVGPLFLVGKQGGDAGAIAYLIANVVVQATGLAMLLASPFLPRDVEVPNDSLSWSVVPVADSRSVGAQLVLRGF